MKKILVILGHPNSESFAGALFEKYVDGALDAGHEVRVLKLSEMSFDPILWKGYTEVQPLEDDLVEAQEFITWCDHLVFVYPVWWGTMPPLLHGFIDRVFLPGFAFKYHDDDPMWDKLLAGRTAHVIATADTPWWWYRFVFRRPGYHHMKRTILGFCGIKLKRYSLISPIRGSSPEKRAAWLSKVHSFGKSA